MEMEWGIKGGNLSAPPLASPPPEPPAQTKVGTVNLNRRRRKRRKKEEEGRRYHLHARLLQEGGEEKERVSFSPYPPSFLLQDCPAFLFRGSVLACMPTSHSPTHPPLSLLLRLLLLYPAANCLFSPPFGRRTLPSPQLERRRGDGRRMEGRALGRRREKRSRCLSGFFSVLLWPPVGKV